MLDAALGVLVERRVDLFLVAGDIYDRSIPQPEAIELFDAFLNRAADALPGLVTVAIPGNHDSAARLSFGSALLAKAGFHLRTRAEDSRSPVVVRKGEERLLVWAIPFLEAGALEAEIGRIRPLLDPAAPNLLLAHCFASGGSPSESERGFIGTAEEVPASLFEGFDYAALGHLHRRQAAGPFARYPGSPLAYSFSEAEASPEKGFLLVELGADLPPGAPGPFAETFVPLPPLHRLRRLEGSFAELSAPGAFPEARGDFVEARLTDPLPVLDPADPLKANFPNLVAVRQAAFERPSPAAGPDAGPAGEGVEATDKAGERDGEAVLSDFRSFYGKMRGEGPSAETEALFAGLLKEAEDASR